MGSPVEVAFESDGTVTITGTASAVQDLALELRGSMDPGAHSPATKGQIEVVQSTAPRVLVVHVGDSLILRGSVHALSLMAESFELVARQAMGYGGSHHTHIEYFDDHPFLERGSAPLVVEAVA